MNDSHIISETAELAALENSCKQFSAGLDAVMTRFRSATDSLGMVWQDGMYAATRARVEPVFASCSKALSVVTGSLEPFIAKKRAWADSRPSA